MRRASIRLPAATIAGLAAAGLALGAALLVRAGPFALGPVPDRPRDVPLPERPERIERLLVLGTSLSHDARWPDALADRLAACTGTRPALEVIARAGATSDWGAGTLEARTGPRPDAALVEFGVNDADRRDGLSAAESRDAHARILAALDGVPTAAMRMNPAFGPRGWTRLGRAAREDAIAAQAAAAGAGALDLDWRWRRRWRTRSRRADAPDGLHPDPVAAAEVIAPAAAALLAAACSEDL